ncbi:hypothetical protein GGX14DRAFT_593206 [Mycena pura]|uniref:Uncharacterized protein n=1 Tax=Mycena pura TaxID=153505 RepID=A0AAD6Y3W8_9AGAR|nr:hypothetical protein GGX14DRAFT_593206 [Mycena pura]
MVAFPIYERRSSANDSGSSEYSAVSGLNIDDVGKEDMAIPVINDTKQNAFNATARVTIPASTSGIPEYANFSVINATRNYMITFPVESLPWRGIFDDSQMVGLSNGSLYEVLDATTPGNDKAQVSAIGFNITCGYRSAKIQSVDVIEKSMEVLFDGVSSLINIGHAENLIPNTLLVYWTTNNSLFILTTIAISDSGGHQGSPILFDQQSHSVIQNLTLLNLNISQLGLFRCSKSLVTQTGLISAQSNTIIDGSLYPDIHKTQSTWISGLELDFTSQDSSLLGDDLWSTMFELAFTNDFDGALDDKCEKGSRYLMSYLGLDPFANTSAPVVQLHNFENALSNLVAILFWMGGHMSLDQWYTSYSLSVDGSSQGGVPPKLVAGNATIIQEETLQIRLNNTPKLSSPLVELNRASLTAKTSTLCMLMHVFLVMTHIIALVFALQRKEHGIIFSLDRQQAVSLICKIATTAFGTIFYALLIYLTQRLATTNAIHKYSLLTAIHDKSLAWTGNGSAFSTLYEQIKSPGSFLEIFIICLYLATVSGLHVTTSAFVSVESFNLSTPTKVQTRSIPEWSDSVDNSTLKYIAGIGSSLQWINGLDDSQKLGLSNGSLYDVLEHAYPGSGLAEVSALGFNITCGYIPDIAVQIDAEMGSINVSSLTERLNLQFFIPGSMHSSGQYAVQIIDIPLEPNYLLITYSNPLRADSIVLSTQNYVYDSKEALGSPVTLLHPNVTLQFLECSNSPVRQMGRVNASTGLLDPSSLYPTIHKHTSAWREYQNVSNAGVLDQTSMLGGNYWTQILTQFGDSGILAIPTQADLSIGVDYGSMYGKSWNLMQQLGLNPHSAVNTAPDVSNQSATAQVIYLHDIENALSNLVASIFWAGGNVHPSPLAIQGQFGSDNLPNLSAGNATVKQVVLAARLDMSLPAVSIGLAGSIILLILIGWISIGTNRSNLPLAHLGLLQIIWIFEHHPELHEILEQVDDPTDDNLRSAGLINVCLADAFPTEERDS